MQPIDYKKLGFKAGLECHQQLEGKKLFCNCPTLNSDEKQDVYFERFLRAVAGETGAVDIAAQHETKKGLKYSYIGDSQDTCLIDYDEEPPRALNKDALETTLTVALLLHASIVDEIQIMRKTVVDGSNVSGFQRTALVARNGFIETSLGKVHIPTICLEEEACQKVEASENSITYKLDRLGIPLIEIATDATIQNAEHAKEAAEIIGMVLRSVSGIKRGLGTIRQDVNVSIKDGARTEIKGFQDLRSIPKVVDFEIRRQLDAITKGKKLEKEVRKAEPDFSTSFLRPMPGAARLYPETDVVPIRVDKTLLEKLSENLPRLLNEQIDNFSKKYKLSKDLAEELLENQGFVHLCTQYQRIEPSLIAQVLVTIPKEIKSRLKLDPSVLQLKDFEEVLSYLAKGKITKEAIIDILAMKIKGEVPNLKGFESVSDSELENDIKKVIEEKPNLSASAYMGLLMPKYRGKIEGKKIMEMIQKNLKTSPS